MAFLWGVWYLDSERMTQWIVFELVTYRWSHFVSSLRMCQRCVQASVFWKVSFSRTLVEERKKERERHLDVAMCALFSPKTRIFSAALPTKRATLRSWKRTNSVCWTRTETVLWYFEPVRFWEGKPWERFRFVTIETSRRLRDRIDLARVHAELMARTDSFDRLFRSEVQRFLITQCMSCCTSARPVSLRKLPRLELRSFFARRKGEEIYAMRGE